MGNFSRDTFKLTNTMYQQITGEKVKDPRHYAGVRLQQGVPLVDADWNELEDIRRYEERAMLKWLVGDGVPQGNEGFLIKGAKVSDFTMNQGVCYVNGWTVINLADMKYTAQELYNNDKLAAERGVEPLPPIQLESGQQYGVYLDVWEREINRWEDGRIVNEAIGIETCVRIKREWAVRVAAGAQAPAVKAGHGYYKLAVLTVASAASVTVTDLRRTDLAVLPKEFIVKNGKVGVGTTAPDKLQLCVSSADNVWGAGISLDNRATQGGKRYCIATKGGRLSIADMDIPEDRLVIAGNGNVGIGTINPAAKLHIFGGDLRWGYSTLRDNQGGSIELGGDSTTPGRGTPYIDFHYQGLTQDYNTRIINDADGRLSVIAPAFAVHGKVGVGTDKPQGSLHVAGNGDVLNLEGQNHAYIQWYPLGFSAGRKAWLGFGDANTNAFTIRNDAGRMHIDGSELLYLLNKSGVIVGKEWGGNGNLTVQGTFKTQRDLNAVPDTYDPRKLKSISSDRAFILFYKYNEENWAGMGVDSGGHIWIRSGTANSEAHVVLIGNGGFMATSQWRVI